MAARLALHKVEGAGTEFITKTIERHFQPDLAGLYSQSTARILININHLLLWPSHVPCISDAYLLRGSLLKITSYFSD